MQHRDAGGLAHKWTCLGNRACDSAGSAAQGWLVPAPRKEGGGGDHASRWTCEKSWVEAQNWLVCAEQRRYGRVERQNFRISLRTKVKMGLIACSCVWAWRKFYPVRHASLLDHLLAMGLVASWVRDGTSFIIRAHACHSLI